MVLFVNCGIPASGKTTMAERIEEQGVKIISRDDVRNLFGDYSPSKEWYVMKIIEHTVKCHMINGMRVLVDANHASVAQRAQVLQWAKDMRMHGLMVATVILAYDCNLERCILRDKVRNDGVGEEVVRKQFEYYSPPTKLEGSNIVWVDAKETDVDSVLNPVWDLYPVEQDFRL